MSWRHLADGLAFTGFALAMFLFLSQVPTMKLIIRARSAGGYTFTPTLTIFATTFLWSIYAAFVQRRTDLAILNGTGAVLQAVYAVIFFQFSDRPARRRIAGAMGGLAALVVLLAVIAFGGEQQHPGLVGYSAIAFNITVFASPT